MIDIRICYASLDLPAAQHDRCAAVLSPDEHARARRFFTSALQRRFIAARGQLRLMLAAVLDQPPADLAFAYGEHGKPYIDGSSLQFNIAHTDHVMVCGIAHDYSIGIDLEDTRREIEVFSVARQFFAPEEVELLQQSAPSEQNDLFFDLWTRKEAYLKARGVGIARGQLDEPLILDAHGIFTAYDGTRWSVIRLTPFAHHRLALVTPALSPAWSLQAFDPASP